jgi:hypothetical protein
MGNALSNPPTMQPAVTDGVSKVGTHIFTEIWKRWFIDLAKLVNDNAQVGESVTVDLAAITPGGTAGSLTFEHGKLTSYTPPT